jgi:hypothetical protein
MLARLPRGGMDPYVEVSARFAEEGIVCADRADASVDVCTRIFGARFSELRTSRREFVVKCVNIPIGRLQQLIESKRSANQPKDAVFLEQHKESIEALLPAN